MLSHWEVWWKEEIEAVSGDERLQELDEEQWRWLIEEVINKVEGRLQDWLEDELLEALEDEFEEDESGG